MYRELLFIFCLLSVGLCVLNVPTLHQKIKAHLETDPSRTDPLQSEKEDILEYNLDSAIINALMMDRRVCTDMTYELGDYPLRHPHLNYLDKKYKWLGYLGLTYTPKGWVSGLEVSRLCVLLQ